MDGLGIATVLTTDTKLDVGAGGAALLDGDLDQLADTDGVDGLEGVEGEDLLLDVLQQETALSIVTAVAERHLREVVGAEAEEGGLLRDLVGRQGATRDLDHGAELVIERNAGAFLDLLGLGLEQAAHT